MRAEKARAGQADIPLGEPGDFTPPPEAVQKHGPLVVMHLLHEDGSTLSGAVPLSDVPDTIKQMDKLNLDRIDARDFIEEAFLRQEHIEQHIAEMMMSCALWNALTADASPTIQTVMDTGHCRLVYQITHIMVDGKKAVNFRLLVGDSRRSLQGMLAESAALPRTSYTLSQRKKPFPVKV